MGLLYFFETTIQFRDINPKHLFKTWSDIVEAFIQYPMTNTGVEIKQFWKVRLKMFSRLLILTDLSSDRGGWYSTKLRSRVFKGSWINDLFEVTTASAY